LQVNEWPLPSEVARPPSRPRRTEAVFKAALELHFPTESGLRALRPPIRPVGGPILRTTASASPTEQYPVQWQRLRRHLLDKVVRQSADETMRLLKTYGKTLPAMIAEMDALHERHAESPAVSVPAAAPPADQTASRLTALLAAANGEQVFIVDSGAKRVAVTRVLPSATRRLPVRS
jgi:hypothetical protein